MYYCCGITDIGAAADNNEDAFLIDHMVMTSAQVECDLRPPFIIAVADGVGGEEAGECASRLSLELLSRVTLNKKTDLKAETMKIHECIKRDGMRNNTYNMQTTLCGLYVDENNKARLINCGDSRMYRYRFGSLTQLSVDQSLVQMLYDEGRITFAEKLSHEKRNVIFPVLGNTQEDPKPDIRLIDDGIKRGDVIMLCSDGLSDYVTKGEMEYILSLPMRLSKRLKWQVDRAIANGSPDNITIVALYKNQ